MCTRGPCAGRVNEMPDRRWLTPMKYDDVSMYLQRVRNSNNAPSRRPGLSPASLHHAHSATGHPSVKKPSGHREARLYMRPAMKMHIAYRSTVTGGAQACSSASIGFHNAASLRCLKASETRLLSPAPRCWLATSRMTRHRRPLSFSPKNIQRSEIICRASESIYLDKTRW